MDTSVNPTHGGQEGASCNGHFGCSCYHPLFVFNRFGHLERCALRPGKVHSAHGWHDVLEAEGYKYVIPLKTITVLQASVGLPPCGPLLSQLQLSGQIVEPEASCGHHV